MGAIRGNAAITWTDTDDITTERVLLLREPLRELRPAHSQSVYVGDSLDFANRQTFTIGEGVDELVGNIRYMDDPQGLLDLIKAGTKQRTLTYIPDLDDGDRRYACFLISPLSPLALGMDGDRGVSFGELTVEIRLRKTDKTPFQDPWSQGRLFSWRAGGRMEEATFSRADTASYAALPGGAGYGTLTTAGSGIARTHWMSTVVAGPRTVPTLLLEDARTNRVLQSEGGTSLWTKTSITATTSQADPRGGTKGWKLNDASTTVTGIFSQSITITAATRAVMSLFVAAGTAPTLFTEFKLLTGGTTNLRGRFNFSSGIPTFTANGAGTVVGSSKGERWRNNFYRLQIRTTANQTTGAKTIQIIPAATAAAARNSVFVFGPMVE